MTAGCRNGVSDCHRASRGLGWLALQLTGVLVCMALGAGETQASDLIWHGHYRLEGVYVKQPELAGGFDKTYVLNHLVLDPKFIPSDALSVRARLHIMSNGSYPNSQLGATLGRGPGKTTPTSADDSNVLSQAQEMGAVKVSQLYLTWKTEWGAFVGGRVPIHFGLGMSHSAGKNLFDHWIDNKDLVGYKFVVGNMFFMPMYGKVNEGPGLSKEDDVNDLMLDIEYENLESHVNMGFFLEKRTATSLGNDVPTGPFTGATRAGGWEVQKVNLFFRNETETYSLGVEAAFEGGDTGLVAGGTEIATDGLGVVMELESRWPGSFRYGLKAGYATGDDPTTTGKFEGYIFDRNYDVASLLFNHPLGQYDVLQSGLMRGPTTDLQGASPTSENYDTEAISNAVYLAPYLTWQWNESSLLTTRLAYGVLNQAVAARDLGVELDLIYSYKPYENLQWVTEFALLSPGSAFAGTSGYETGIIYGLTTKAAVSF